MQFNKLKTIAAAALSVAMLFSAAACGTSDKAGDSGSDKGGSSKSVTITSYDVSSVKKDDAIAALLPESVTKDGKLTIGTNPSYAPAEFLDADGKTQIGYDMDLARAMGNIFGLDTEIVSSNFDTIIPAIGSQYDGHRRLHHHQGAHGIRRLRLLLHRRHGLCSGRRQPQERR